MRHRDGTAVLLAAVLAAASASAVEVVEVEPNDDAAQAEANNTLFSGSGVVTGSIAPIGDVDRFRFDLVAFSTVRIESFDGSGTECAGGMTTTLRLYYEPGSIPIALDDFEHSGIAGCSALVLRLSPGSYDVSLEESGNDAAIPAYRLQFQILADQGSEAEPNDNLGFALPLVGSDTVVYGDHIHDLDQDWYVVTIGPHGGSIRAEVIEGDRPATCESLGIDSQLTLYSSTQDVLADDDDSGRGYCSRIDGTGAAPEQAGAHDLPPGTYYLLLRGSTNGGAPPAGLSFDYRLALTVVPNDMIFKDGVESGTFSSWAARADDGGDLSVDCTSAIRGTCDLKGVVNDTNSLYVEDQSPLDEDRYRARFVFDTATFNPGTAESHFRTRIFLGLEEAPTRRLMAVVLKFQSGQYSVMGRARLDDNSQADTGFYNISPGVHVIELDWVRATSPSSADGLFQFWLDASLVSTSDGLQNNASSVDFARLGALSVKTGASGVLFWDDFESRRRGYIGP